MVAVEDVSHPASCEAPDGVPAARGAYGLRLSGLAVDHLLPGVEADAPRLDVVFSCGQVDDRAETLTAERAEIPLVEDGWVSLDRSGHAKFVLPRPVVAEEMLHPWLVPAAATFNGWLGRQVLHGGILSRDDRAVAVLGDKEAGKSSLLAWLAATERFAVLADDLVTVERGRVFAGPRCIDLRPGGAPALPAADRMRVVRNASRIRLELPQCRRSANLVGIVILAWEPAGTIRLERLTPSQALAALLPHASASAANPQGSLLELLGVPVWVLSRRREWAVMSDVARALDALLD